MTYSEIIALALSLSDREDSDLPLRLDGFLQLVEAEVNRLLRSLEKETSTIIPYTSDDTYQYLLPADYEEMRFIGRITGTDRKSKVPYEFCNPEQISWACQNKCVDLFYSINENQLEIYPSLSSTQAIFLTYMQKVPPLSSAITSNWLSNKHPDLYVSGLLLLISVFAKDWASADRFSLSFDKVIQQIFAKDLTAKYSGNSLRTRVG
jgi:hypothetical protein